MPFAQERFEGGADRQGASLAEHAVGNCDADHGVDGPGMQPPVEEGRRHGCPDGVLVPGSAGAGRGSDEVSQGLGGTVEHEADPHPGGEHHGDPGHRGELGALAVAAEGDVAVFPCGEPQHEEDESSRGEGEEPASVVDNPFQADAGRLAQRHRGDDAPPDEGDRQQGGDAEHDAVQRTGAFATERLRGRFERRMGGVENLALAGHARNACSGGDVEQAPTARRGLVMIPCRAAGE